MNDARIAERRRTKHRRWRRQSYQNPRPHQPTLRFSPTAWAKLLFLRDLGPTEVGGFGISAADDCLRIEDVQLVRQSCTSVTVHFDDADADAADYFVRSEPSRVRLLREFIAATSLGSVQSRVCNPTPCAACPRYLCQGTDSVRKFFGTSP